MIEARRLGDEHQAKSLAEWCDGGFYTGTPPNHSFSVHPRNLVPGSKVRADVGDWIIRYPDGTIRVEPGGNQDGYCTDCGLPVWWQDDRLVTRSGLKWCQGENGSHPGMERWHALPDMAQYVVQAPDGQVCHCLDRKDPHIHQIVPVPEEAP